MVLGLPPVQARRLTAWAPRGILPLAEMGGVGAMATSASFGDLLRRYRLAAGLTQDELAERAQMSVRGISDLERGFRQTPRRSTVDLLADALRLTAEHRATLTTRATRAR